jgi:hypothetical protein
VTIQWSARIKLPVNFNVSVNVTQAVTLMTALYAKILSVKVVGKLVPVWPQILVLECLV